MNILIKSIFFIIGIILILNGIVSAIAVRMNLASLISILLGIFNLSVFITFNNIKDLIKETIIGKMMLVIFSIFLLLFIIVETIIIINENNSYSNKSDAVIVLGAGLLGDRVSLTLQYRLERAMEYVNIYPNTYIVVSGGQGANELTSEADAMKRYLIDRGISEEKIIVEDKSTSTSENFKFSKELLDEKIEKDNYIITYSTNDFHVYRAGKIAESQGLTAYGLSAKSVWYMTITNHLREFFAVIKLWTLGYK